MAMSGRFQHTVAISPGRLREQHDHEVLPSTMLDVTLPVAPEGNTNSA